jgi:hypothetical protein
LVGGECREFLNHETSMAHQDPECNQVCATLRTGPGGLDNIRKPV